METMMKDTANGIKETIEKFIIQNFMFGDANERIDPDTSFLESGIIDSTGILELIPFVDNTYSISFDENELVPENLDSLNNLERFILQKQG